MRCLTNFLRRLSGSQPRPSPEKAFRNCCCRTLHLLHRGNGGPGAFTKFKEKREWGPEPRTLFLHPQHSALPCTALFCEGRNGPLSQLDRLRGPRLLKDVETLEEELSFSERVQQKEQRKAGEGGKAHFHLQALLLGGERLGAVDFEVSSRPEALA